jgi:hypothetical protein
VDDYIRALFGFSIKGKAWQFVTGAGGLLGLASDEPENWRDWMDATDAAVKASRAEEEASAAANESNRASETARDLQHESDMAEAYAQRAANEASKAAEASAADPNNAQLAARAERLGRVAKNTREAADKAKQAADKAKEEATKKAEEAEKKKEEADRKKKELEEKRKKLHGSTGGTQQPSSSGASGNGSEEFGLNTCEQLQNSWSRFKSECERTDSWNRPGTDCNDLVRNQLGCVDIRLIQPTPDDLTMSCRRGNGPHVDVCEKQRLIASKWLSSIEPGDATCAAWDSFSVEIAGVPYSPLDICRNPAARPQEGQCLGKAGSENLGTGLPASDSPPKFPGGNHGLQFSMPRLF